MRSVSKRKQITTISTVPNRFIFCICIICTVFQLFYGKNSSKETIESSKQAHNTKKTEYVKTEQFVAIWLIRKLLELQKFWKIRMTEAICILMYCKKNWHFSTLWSKTRIIFVREKVFVFQQDQTTITQEDPKLGDAPASQAIIRREQATKLGGAPRGIPSFF